MFHIYSSSQREDKFNIIYEREFEIDNEKLFAEAVSYDYVCAKFKNNRHSNINFISSDCIEMDIEKRVSTFLVLDSLLLTSTLTGTRAL